GMGGAVPGSAIGRCGLIPSNVGEVHREVARVVLAVAQRDGFVLGGGVAWGLDGLGGPKTEDLGFFTDRAGSGPEPLNDVEAALQAAGFEVRGTDPTDPYAGEAADEADDLSDLFYGFAMEMAEIYVGRDGRWLKISLSVLPRTDSPVVMSVGPVMSVDDLIG